MAEYLQLFKALHIVGVVGWFGGLFYLVRIFVYHAEAFNKSDAEKAVLLPQYHLMETRAFKIICRPGMIITWTFGLLMIYVYGWEWFTVNYWLHAKLFLVMLLSGYNDYCARIIRQLEEGKLVMSSFKFRLLNEVPSVFLLAIVLLAVYKNGLDFIKAFIGVALFMVALFAIAKRYKKIREQADT